jgi:WD40 repeat protein
VVAHPSSPAVVTASADKTVVISPVTGTRVVPLGKGKPNGVVVSPGNERVLSVGPGREVTSWNTGSGAKERVFAAGADATAAAISKDGQRVAVGAADGSVKVYTVADAKLVGGFAAGGPVAALAFQPTGAVLAGLVKDKENSAVAWNVGFAPGQPVPPEFGQQLQAFPHPARRERAGVRRRRAVAHRGRRTSRPAGSASPRRCRRSRSRTRTWSIAWRSTTPGTCSPPAATTACCAPSTYRRPRC